MPELDSVSTAPAEELVGSWTINKCKYTYSRDGIEPKKISQSHGTMSWVTDGLEPAILRRGQLQCQ